MDNISRVMARIDTIRSQVGMPANPGQFQAALDTHMAPASLQMTAMGSVRPVATVALPVNGVMSAVQLDSFVEQHGVYDRPAISSWIVHLGSLGVRPNHRRLPWAGAHVPPRCS